MSVTVITKENVKRIQRHRYFNEQDFNIAIALKNKEINSQIQLNLQRLMMYSMTRNNVEVVIALDLDTFDWRGHTDMDYCNVSIPPHINNAILNSSHLFLIMHNHPNNSTFSLADVLALIAYPNAKVLIMCTNDCNFIEVLYKSNNEINPLIDKFTKILRKLSDKNIIDRHADAKFIISILTKFGFKYDKYSNK